MKPRAWLSFFRAVNIPTVPGDVLVGAAAMLWAASRTVVTAVDFRPAAIIGASVASVFLYLFGLADNDLVGAKTDGPERPIPCGDLSPRAGAVARGLCLAGALLTAAVADLPSLWWPVAFALTVAEVLYNRFKFAFVMGLCRGLNVVCGAAALVTGSVRGVPVEGRLALFVVAAVWVAFITGVTLYAAGEGEYSERRPRVGLLLGSLVYLQILALIFFTLQAPAAKPLLVAGAFLLIALRLFKRLMPGVSAS